MDRGATVHGVTELDTNEQLTHSDIYCVLEFNVMCFSPALTFFALFIFVLLREGSPLPFVSFVSRCQKFALNPALDVLWNLHAGRQIAPRSNICLYIWFSKETLWSLQGYAPSVFLPEYSPHQCVTVQAGDYFHLLSWAYFHCLCLSHHSWNIPTLRINPPHYFS